ncbi:hypothetical protein IKA15_04180 [bacterium]|nr:hypothetical protein [bacterium]
MGKSKRRILHKTNSSLFMTRESALNEVFGLLNKDNFKSRQKARDIITLFGLEAEELCEAGVDYENVKAFENLIEKPYSTFSASSIIS